MKIKFQCPAGHTLKARPDKAGTTFACPACGAKVTVPEPQSPGEKVAAADSQQPTRAIPPPLPTNGDAAPPAAAPPPLPPPLPIQPAENAASEDAATATPTAVAEPPPEPPPTVPSEPRLSLAEKMGRRISGCLPVEGTAGYRPDASKFISVFWLTAALAGIVAIEMIPLSWHTDFVAAPVWAQALLLLSLLKLVYVVWMASFPDYSTVWSNMLVFAASAALYGFVLAIVLLTPRGQDMMFQLGAVRRLAPVWSAAMMLLTFLGAYLCGRTSSRWFRAYQATIKSKSLAR